MSNSVTNEKQLNLTQQLALAPDEQNGFWYDWFCKETSPPNKTKSLIAKVKAIAKSSRFKADEVYVFFKNNCPVGGSLYDSFSICDLASGDVLFFISPHDGHSGKAEVWGPQTLKNEPDFGQIFQADNWAAVKEWFMIDDDARRAEHQAEKEARYAAAQAKRAEISARNRARINIRYYLNKLAVAVTENGATLGLTIDQLPDWEQILTPEAIR